MHGLPLQLLRTLRSIVLCKDTQWHGGPGWSAVLSHYHSCSLASIGLLTVSRICRAKPLPATWTSCLQWAHITYWREADVSAWSVDRKCLYPTVPNHTLSISPSCPNTKVSTYPFFFSCIIYPSTSPKPIAHFESIAPHQQNRFTLLGSLNDTLPLSTSYLREGRAT